MSASCGINIFSRLLLLPHVHITVLEMVPACWYVCVNKCCKTDISHKAIQGNPNENSKYRYATDILHLHDIVVPLIFSPDATKHLPANLVEGVE